MSVRISAARPASAAGSVPTYVIVAVNSSEPPSGTTSAAGVSVICRFFAVQSFTLLFFGGAGTAERDTAMRSATPIHSCAATAPRIRL